MTDADAMTEPTLAPARWSRLAMGSLVLSVIPLGSVFAPILGIVALVRLRSRPDLRGRAFAWGGIVLGIVASVLMVGGAYGIYRSFRALSQRPSIALRAAWDGNAETFRAQMAKPGGEATTAEIARWVAPLKARYGELVSVDLGPAAPPAAGRPTPERQMRASYVATFRTADQASVAVPLEVTFEPPAGADSVQSILVRRLAFTLPDGARIVFPDDERPDPEKPEQPAADRR